MYKVADQVAFRPLSRGIMASCNEWRVLDKSEDESDNPEDNEVRAIMSKWEKSKTFKEPLQKKHKPSIAPEVQEIESVEVPEDVGG